MSDSIFTKIIKGEIPCHKVYEDDQVLAFLDIHPKTPGHVLIVPKKQVKFVWNLGDEEYQHLMGAAKKIAGRIQDVLEPTYVGLQIEGLGVPHAHVHVFPFENARQYHYVPDQSVEPDHDQLSKIATKLAF
ncbi:MAG TPA: HIT domain-containing protein [Candidatus Saccharimonadales bacterium]|nr:HIT domain-containing protein [Candidatus Saccharimonadales bacterium]